MITGIRLPKLTLNYFLSINLFRPRTIPQAEGPTDPDGKEAWDKARAAGVPLPGPLFHKSVLERMQLNNVPEVEVRSWKTMFMKSSYRPYAEPPKGFEPVYVE
ncbi:hypothetical protein DL93DRAFT_2070874 [Clavulina sp. PMI_390]|nr:hypothetical protein DL93DRAFT_2070874 [Clavulina sp. PMI_390]